VEIWLFKEITGGNGAHRMKLGLVRGGKTKN
jgi:hypothetical protein